MRGVDPPHDRGSGPWHGPRFIAEAAPAGQKRRLPRQRQVMGPVDHRFAPSRPALLGAPDEKPSSKASPPILARSAFTSMAGGVPDAAPPEPDRPGAASTSRPFQAVTRLGWASCRCAGPASVFSPLIAASATLALKTAARVRRARSVMLAPDPRQPRRPQAEIPLTGPPELGRPALVLLEVQTGSILSQCGNRLLLASL